MSFAQVFFSALQPPVLGDKASAVIFANVEDILFFNTAFYSELDERQRVARLYIDEMGDIVANHMPGLDIYRPYCVNQANAARTLADIKASDTALRAKIDVRTRPRRPLHTVVLMRYCIPSSQGLRVKDLQLEHFLLEPMQRLARYPLLINQVRRKPSAQRETKALSRARNMCTDLALH